MNTNRIRSGSANKAEDRKGVLKQGLLSSKVKNQSRSSERVETVKQGRSLSKRSSQESLSGDEHHKSKRSSKRSNKNKSKATKRSSKSPKSKDEPLLNQKKPEWIEDLRNQGIAVISINVFQSNFCFFFFFIKGLS